MVLELILCCYVLMYFAVELIELSRGPKAYLKDVWNALDLTNLAIFFAVILLRLWTVDMIYGTLGIADRLPDLKATEYPNLQSLSQWMVIESNLNALNGWVMWFKLFKYCQVSRRMTLMLRMMGHASTDLFYFMA